MLDPVVNEAKKWGFICQRQQSNFWLILPQQQDRRWKLEQAEDRWILIVGDVPQLRLPEKKAIAFLESRWLENNT